MNRKHREVFFAMHGTGPFNCYFCRTPVIGSWDGGVSKGRNLLVVHHVDLDHHNNDPTNLVAAHSGCHNRFHMLMGGALRAQAAVDPSNTSAAMKKRWEDPTYREKVIASLRGKVRDEHARANYKRAANSEEGFASRSRGGKSHLDKSKSEAHKKKLSESRRGKTISADHAAHLHEGSKKRWERYRREKEVMS